jgi:hypothetical protein
MLDELSVHQGEFSFVRQCTGQSLDWSTFRKWPHVESRRIRANQGSQISTFNICGTIEITKHAIRAGNLSHA